MRRTRSIRCQSDDFKNVSDRHGRQEMTPVPLIPSIAADEHLLAVLRYIERNPLRAGLVERAEDWRWGSLYWRTQGVPEQHSLLADSLVPLGRLWREHVYEPQNEAELAAIRRSIPRGEPFGGEGWQKKVTKLAILLYTYML